jgi:ElaB/YqjD/DUF883 family membrane-anchored ribosome-binding protein
MEDRMSPNSKTKTDPHPGMMGDGTEEQNLDQRGDPSARITEDEVEKAFGGRNGASSGEDSADRWASLRERGAAVRDHVANSAEAVRDWAGEQAASARRAAAEKPVLVVSASAATALAIGLGIGFVLGRATADD